MNASIQAELRTLHAKGVANGDIPAPVQLDKQTSLFRARFGPLALQAVDGEELLKLMHGRQDNEARCMAYWLEFKNDDEFAGNSFGGIRGGTALKFGIYQRQQDGAWTSGTPRAPVLLTLDQAIAIAESQRAELVNGTSVLSQYPRGDSTDASYQRLQEAMETAAPNLSRDGWAHKYWFLMHPETLDAYHSPAYQRFHLIKLLQMPPDGVGILKGSAPRFLCAGRFAQGANDIGVPIVTFNKLLNLRDTAFHRYWKVGTTEGSAGDSHWQDMRDGGFISIGWKNSVPDLTQTLNLDPGEAKGQIAEFLKNDYDNGAMATRKAGEILNFAREMAEPDMVVACEGQTVLGVGRIVGPYEYDGSLRFPHKRPVKWMTVGQFKLGELEGPRTTVYELGKHAINLLEIEKQVAGVAGPSVKPASPVKASTLKPLDVFAARVEAILRRKGQVILYGPPGTGKTYRGLGVAQELAARHAFNRSFGDLAVSEKQEIEAEDGLVRICTFHPGWGYENFMEGLHPKTVSGGMVFEPRDGVFKKLCRDASASKKHFYLVIDEINRGDLPRIFGELITVIERDKRGRDILLPVTGSKFRIPENVFILGTMNTSDRSISLLDTALRRRFGFVELMPDSGSLLRRSVGAIALGPWLDALNARIRKHLKRDARNLQIGHAYLMPVNSAADFSRVFRDEILPLLEEYCYDDLETLGQILGGALIDVENSRIREELFDQHNEDDLFAALHFPEMHRLTLTEEATGTGQEDAAQDEDAEIDGGSPA
ncbi:MULTISPECIES: AAA family ATPase [unclassified Polaromonas]|uniref:AAA family ATPase n=1 Tax=unclassified Polaromonas TaxID=2638319 RepID=UPI0013DDE668|nr:MULTISPECIES: AAA family ATPase [unclassified Polaromonas]